MYHCIPEDPQDCTCSRTPHCSTLFGGGGQFAPLDPKCPPWDLKKYIAAHMPSPSLTFYFAPLARMSDDNTVMCSPHIHTSRVCLAFCDAWHLYTCIGICNAWFSVMDGICTHHRGSTVLQSGVDPGIRCWGVSNCVSHSESTA